MSSIDLKFKNQLLKRQAQDALRVLKSQSLEHIDFCSNDYLGLARCQKLKSLTLFYWEQFFPYNGSTGSRLVAGNNPLYEEIEHHIADFHGYEAAILFNCGFMANLALISAIIDQNSTLIFDSHIHASIRQGILSCRGNCYAFRHNDLDHLEFRLKNRTDTTFVAIESIYSMDGSIAPLKEISLLCEKYKAYLIVDEAHSIGLHGPNGKGLIAENQIDTSLCIQVNPCGKALGVQGAIILCSKILKDYLINFAIPFVYTTAPSPAQVAAIFSCYKLFPHMDAQRKNLRSLILSFNSFCNEIGFSHSPSKTQIKPFVTHDAKQALFASNFLRDRGFDVKPILSPTVQKGSERLRICLHSFNSYFEMRQLLNHLKELETSASNHSCRNRN